MTCARRILVTTILLVVIVAAPGGADSLVQRVAGANRADTAARLALDAWTGSDEVVLVDGGDHVSALIGAHHAAVLDVPVLVSGAVLPTETTDAIRELAVNAIIAIGDVATPDGIEVTRIASDGPTELAAEVAGLAPDGLPVLLASHTTFADALAGANLAPAVLLLTDPEELSGPALAAIRDRDPDEVIVLGGRAAVSDRVQSQVEAEGVRVRRIAGENRIATSLAAASRAGGLMALASADGFADAIALVPWAARREAAVVLTTHDELTIPVETRLRQVSYTQLWLTGGGAAIGNFVDLQGAAALAGAPAPGYLGSSRVLTSTESAQMTGVSWHEDCPVPLADLRVVQGRRWLPDGNIAEDGELIVHRDVVDDVSQVLTAAFDGRFAIERMRPVREFDADDDASMAANNTSAFNCRAVAGTTRWSEHAYGWAVDINPVQNPYVRGSEVEPTAGAAFLDRSNVRPGMLVEGHPVVAAFDALGWEWGARWSSSLDYQHFSQTGR